MGCGGIGGLVSAHLYELGVDVTPVTTNPAIADAVNRRGFQVTGDGNPRVIAGRMHVGVPPRAGGYDVVLLATQPPQVEEAARTAAPHLAPGGAMVCFQNGLCEARIARIVGPERVVGGIVAWGAAMPAPGVYERTSDGGFVVGRLDGSHDALCDSIARMLEVIGPVALTDNLAGARWSKLAINAAISSLGTIGGDRLGPLVLHRTVRRLVLEVMTEAVAVARREGVRLEKVAGTLDLEWIALTDEERRAAGSVGLASKHTLLLAVGFRYRRMRSSMLAAIERGRPPAVDFLNGEIVERARRHGLAAPINEAVVTLVHAIARGEKRSGLPTLRALYAETRAAAGAPVEPDDVAPSATA
jgi:2-dehydropantoate 2-reductase